MQPLARAAPQRSEHVGASAQGASGSSARASPRRRATEDPEFASAVKGGFDRERLGVYFWARPLELASRLAQVFGATWNVYSTWTSEETLEESQRQRGSVLTKALESLGPAFVKVGQTLAQRPDLVGDEAAEAMKVLQVHATPFSDDLAMQIIADDLGHDGPLAPGVPCEGCDPTRPPLFRAFSQKAIASASLGQVYKATTHEGLDVAVKVQRPGVARQLALDWISISFLASVYQFFVPSLNDYSLLVNEAVRNMLLEVDYHHEASNAQEFERRHAFLGFVRVPKFLLQYTGPQGTARVLTMEWIVGRRISDLPRKLGRQAVQMAVQACVVQLLLTGNVHADPHEGNLLFTDDGQLAFLDFGLMDTVEPKIMEGFADGIQGVVSGDWRRVTQAMQTVGFVSTPVQKLIDPSSRDPLYKECGFEEVVDAVARQMKDQDGGESRFSAMASGLEKLSWTYLMLTPSYIVLITRTFMTLEGLAERVDPDFNIYTAALPIAVRRALSPRTKAARQAMRETVLAEGGKLRWERLEALLAGDDGSGDTANAAALPEGSLRAAWKAEPPPGGLTSAAAGGSSEEKIEGFDVMGGLLGSPDGAALRRIAYDLDVEASVKFLASQGGRSWRRRAAAFFKESFRFRKPSLVSARVGAATELPLEQQRWRQRERQMLRFMLARYWRRLVGSSGLVGAIFCSCLLGGVIGRVVARAAFLALISAVVSWRRSIWPPKGKAP